MTSLDASHHGTLDDDKFHRQIGEFPSSFQLEIETDLSKTSVTNILERLNREADDESCNEEEHARRDNLISFLYWNLEKKNEAFSYCKCVSDKDECNVISVANKAYYHWNNNEFYEAECCLEQLIQLKTRENYSAIEIQGKSELAYSYSRFGPKFHQKAVTKFEEVIKENGTNYLWKFGFGLTLRRQLHLYNNPHYLECSRIEIFQKSITTLFDVVSNTSINNKELCAKAWVELGELLYNHNTNIDPELENVTLPESLMKIDYIKCFDNAYTLSKNDAFVCERAGKYYRYKGNLQKSEGMLREAIAIRETSFSHHHLALTLKKKAYRRPYNQFGRSQSYTPEFSHRSVAKWQEESFGKNTVPRKYYSESDKPDNSQNTPEQVPSNDTVFRDRENVSRQLFTDGDDSDTCKEENVMRDFSLLSIKDQATGTGSNKTQFGLQWADPKGPYQQCLDNFRGKHRYNSKDSSAMLKGGQYFRGISNQDCRGRSTVRRSGSRLNTQNRGRGNGFSCNTNSEHGHIRKSKSYSPTDSKGNLAMEKVVKSPNKFKSSPNNPVLEEAAEHFKRSVTLSKGDNTRAQYDLGLTYVALEKEQEAFEIFKDITTKGTRVGKLNLVNAFEQAGLCLKRLCEKPDCNDANRRKMEYDSKQLLIRAIEVASDAVCKLPTLKMAWKAFPTLRDLLINKDKINTQSMTELAKLHQLVAEYGESIQFYKQVLDTSDDTSQRPKILNEIAKNYVKIEDYENAVLFLSMLCCTGENDLIDKSFYLNTFVRGAIYMFEKGENDKCAQYFKDAFEFCCPCQANADDDSYDVHLICEEQSLKEAEVIDKLLSYHCHLKVTINYRDSLPGHSKLSSTIATMKRSNCVLSVIKPGKLSNEFEYYIDMMVTSKKFIVMITLGEAEVPDHLETFPTIKFDHAEITDLETNIVTVKWLEKLYLNLALFK